MAGKSRSVQGWVPSLLLEYEGDGHKAVPKYDVQVVAPCSGGAAGQAPVTFCYNLLHLPVPEAWRQYLKKGWRNDTVVINPWWATTCQAHLFRSSYSTPLATSATAVNKANSS
ncbi:hypothetical protein GCM10027348_38730 [Hymenobacter tenuis]